MANIKLHSGYFKETLRSWHESSGIRATDLIYPIFVTNKKSAFDEIENFPEQFRIGCDKILYFIKKLVDKNLKSVLIFGVLEKNTDLFNQKDNFGTPATSDRSPVVTAIKLIKREFPNLVVIADVCLCAYTDHGHCGVIGNNGFVDNDKSIARLSEISLLYAKSGADIIAPSDMMDNRILKIRQTLNQKNLQPIAIMSYSAKFASNLYGPFRSACKSGVAKSISSTKNSEICNKIVLKNRKTYQLPSMATNLALKASKRDELEGADFLIVKPAMFYLDIISAVSKNVLVPVAAYQVSGEYVMLFETEKRFENFEIILESLHSIKRAGASMIISYFTPRILDYLINNSEF